MDAAEKTILVVDDDADVRELAVTLLEAVGYRILQAASADAAYRLLLERPGLHIDLLFTDIVMPGSLDGIDLAEKAQALQGDGAEVCATPAEAAEGADRVHC